MFHPTRGGVRGGKDQFSWEAVKADNHKDFYLGHSVKVTHPRSSHGLRRRH